MLQSGPRRHPLREQTDDQATLEESVIKKTRVINPSHSGLSELTTVAPTAGSTNGVDSAK